MRRGSTVSARRGSSESGSQGIPFVRTLDSQGRASIMVANADQLHIYSMCFDDTTPSLSGLNRINKSDTTAIHIESMEQDVDAGLVITGYYGA